MIPIGVTIVTPISMGIFMMGGRAHARFRVVAEIAHAKSAKVGKEFQMHGRRVGGERMIFNFAPHSRDTLTRGCLIFSRGCGTR